MRALTWFEIKQGLATFKELGGNFYILWGIPVIAIVIDLFRSYIGDGFKLPLILFFLFAIAVPYGAIKVVYSLCCPADIQEALNESAWKANALKNKKDILQIIKINAEIDAALEAEFSAKITKALESVPVQDRFDSSQINIIRDILSADLINTLGFLKDKIDDLSKTTDRRLEQENTSRFWARFGCTGLFIFAVVLALAEMVERGANIYHQTF